MDMEWFVTMRVVDVLMTMDDTVERESSRMGDVRWIHKILADR